MWLSTLLHGLQAARNVTILKYLCWLFPLPISCSFSSCVLRMDSKRCLFSLSLSLHFYFFSVPLTHSHGFARHPLLNASPGSSPIIGHSAVVCHFQPVLSTQVTRHRIELFASETDHIFLLNPSAPHNMPISLSHSPSSSNCLLLVLVLVISFPCLWPWFLKLLTSQGWFIPADS